MKTQMTLYHRKASGAIKVWTCSVVGEEVWTTWGQKDGEIQNTKEWVRARKGVSARERAVALFDKKVKKQKKRGYVEALNDVVANIKVKDSALNFDRLPKNFSPAKPIKTIDMETAKSWDQKGLLYIQRKRDGMRHFLVSGTDGTLRIYSSGKDDVTEHLSPLLKGLVLPPCTILDVELTVTEPGPTERDGFLIVSGIARSLALRARDQIKLAQGMGAKVELTAFDLLWLKGVAMYRKPYEYRYTILGEVIANRKCETLVQMPNLVGKDLDRAIQMVKKRHWEGLVIWRKDQATVVHVNGSPARCNCWKVKLVQEEDVIATGYELGKGKNENVVGKFNIAIPGKQGLTSYIPMGRCGTGLSDDMREAALSWKYPCVIQIEYDQKSEKGFRFPVFIRKRDDKKPSELR